MAKQLKKSSNGLLTGVAAGIAEYFNMDPTIVRILFALVTVMGGCGVLIYLLCWLIMPKQ
ncbi:MAG: PspC domain-containing protein [Paludibacteraceae bacterium]|nr:PspC domain-containing protein [Paludibacteraceae bacterium]